MRNLGPSAVLVFLILCGAHGQCFEATNSYSIIRPSDELKITVVAEPDLSGWVTVQTDGSIIIPLLGSVQAAGLIATELQQKLVEKLTQVVRNPSVKVEIGTGPSVHPRKWLDPPPKRQPYPLPEPYLRIPAKAISVPV